MRRWLWSVVALLLGRGRPAREPPPERTLPEHRAPARAERLVALLLLTCALAAAGFVAVYVVGADTQLLGLCLGLAFAFLGAALVIAGRRLVPQEQRVEALGERIHEPEERETAQLLEEGATGVTRRRLLAAAAGGAGIALAGALVVPVASLGPVLDTERLLESAWRRGRRLVDERGRPFEADDVPEGVLLTAFPQGAPTDTFDAPVLVVRFDSERLRLPDERSDWAPEGILAFSKICPHAGCAVSLFRRPLHDPTAPGPALVCPCHYSTFDPTTGGELLFGPAGRPLPQLPLRIGDDGTLVADGPFSGAVGPSWWGVRFHR